MADANVLDACVRSDSARYESVPRNDRYDRSRLILEFVGPNRHVLELGCSTGFFSQRLRQMGCCVIGVELDPIAAERASAICNRVIVADLNDGNWVRQIHEHFEVVLMGDVLEHLLYPEKVLRSVAQLLTQGGFVVVSLPNIVHWTQRVKTLLGQFEYQPLGLLDATHLRFFNLRSARALIEHSGYEVLAFHPIIGGRLSTSFRAGWQMLAHELPNLFGYQFLFRARPLRPMGVVSAELDR
jgi:SAM-dependent methyltransferase